MNRNNDYYELLEKLDNVKIPEGSVKRAVRRRRITSFVTKPLASIALFFAAFVILVNISPTVAMALDGIPIIGGLTRAVRFIPNSVRDAVESNYYQPIDKTETVGDVTLNVEYVIADEKAIVVMYKTECEKYKNLYIDCTYGDGEDSIRLYSKYLNNYSGWMAISQSYLRDQPFPKSGTLRFKIYDGEKLNDRFNELYEEHDGDNEYAERLFHIKVEEIEDVMGVAPVAEFTFDISASTAEAPKPKHYDTDASFELDGQIMKITSIDMYPTFTTFTVKGDPNNKNRVLTGFSGIRDERNRYYDLLPDVEWTKSRENGDYVFSDDDEDTNVYYLESMYFSDTKSVTFLVGGGFYMSKAEDGFEVDLETGELVRPSEIVELLEVKRDGSSIFVKFSMDFEVQLNWDFDLMSFDHFNEYEEEYTDENGHTRWNVIYEYSLDDYKYDTIRFPFVWTGYFSDKNGDWPIKVKVDLTEE